jgi:3'-5' exonuclease
MFKTLEPFLFSFDVEWVPDPLAGELLCGVEENPPYSYEDSYRALWKLGGATEENPQPYLKTILCRIVSIAGIFREESGNNVSLKLVTLPADHTDKEKCKEASILTAFLKAVGSRKPQLVGYNSSRADVPIIVERSIVHGLDGHGFASRPDKPWEGADYLSAHSNYHLDLGADLGRFGMMPRLHEIANLSGIPGKMGISGDSVAEMWLSGNLKGIIDYNEYDAFTTHLLWARMAHFGNLLSSKEYDREQQKIKELLESEIAGGKAHLQAYLEEWLRLKERIKRR